MSKNLCPENNVTVEQAYSIKMPNGDGLALNPGTYTISAVIQSTDTDSSVCLMLFTYTDDSTKEVYIHRSENGERVSETVTLTSQTKRLRLYAGEGNSLSEGDTATYTNLMIEAGSMATDYVPYGEEEDSDEEAEPA